MKYIVTLRYPEGKGTTIARHFVEADGFGPNGDAIVFRRWSSFWKFTRVAVFQFAHVVSVVEDTPEERRNLDFIESVA